MYYSVNNLLADLGGLFSAFYGIFYLLGGFLNRHFITWKISRAIYYFASVYSKEPARGDSVETSASNLTLKKGRFVYGDAMNKMGKSILYVCQCCKVKGNTDKATV